MTTLCALSFVVSLIYAIITCRRSDYSHEGIDWRVLLPMVIGGISGGLCVGGIGMAFLITYPLALALWYFLFMAFCLE